MLFGISTEHPIFIATHTKPDGDAIGSVISCYWLLNQYGYTVAGVVLEEPLEDMYKPIVYQTPIFTPITVRFPEQYTGLLVDAHKLERAGTLATFMTFQYAIDHHPRQPTSIPTCIIEPEEPSCTAIISRTALQYNITIPEIHTPAYYGLFTDTVSFSPSIEQEKLVLAFQRANNMLPFVDMTRIRAVRQPFTYHDAIELADLTTTIVAHGNGVYSALILHDTPLFKKVLATMTSFQDYRIAVVGVYDTQTLRVSLRSNANDPAINGIAEYYGGGGHPHAAGCSIVTTEPSTVFQRIMQDVLRLL